MAPLTEFANQSVAAGAAATDVRPHSRRIASVCSSLNRFLRIRASLPKGPFAQKPTDRKTGSGRVWFGFA